MKDGSAYRKQAQVDSYTTVDGQAVQNGDFVTTGKAYSVTNFSNALYVEGIQDGVYTIMAQLDPDGQSGFNDNFQQQITVTVVSVDADADFANNDGYGMPNESIEDDYAQVSSAMPGKIIGVNDDDSDQDGIPGYADGFAWDPNNADQASSLNDHFTPMTLTLPTDVDVTLAQLRFTYNSSDPTALTHSDNPSKWTPASGNLRIWSKAANQPRNTNYVGDFNYPTPAATYIPGNSYVISDITKLGFTPTTRFVTEYIEGIAPSSSLGDDQIKIELDPMGDGNWIYFDTFHVTVCKVNLDIARKDGSTVPHDQKYSNGSVVQLVPDSNDSNPDGLFLNIPTMSIQPSALSSYVSLKLKKTNPASGNAAGIRFYDDDGIIMGGDAMEMPLTADNLASSTWRVDSTNGGVVDLALVANMQESGTDVELCRSTVRISTIPCAPAVYSPTGHSRIVFVNPNSDAAHAPFDNYTHNAAHSISEATASTFMPADDNILIAGGQEVAAYQENSHELKYGGVLAGLGGSWIEPDPSGYAGPNSELFDFTQLPVVDGTGTGVSIFWADMTDGGSEMTFGGLKMINGYSGANGYSAGGAIFMAQLPSAVPLSVACCDFEANLANNFGGAIYLDTVHEAIIYSSEFNANHVQHITSEVDDTHGMGGAIASLGQSTLSVEDCTFTDDSAMVIDSVNNHPILPQPGSAGGGGDIYTKDGCLFISKSTSTNAVAGFQITAGDIPSAWFTGDGGSILVHGTVFGTYLEITDSLFFNSISYGNGGAISISYDSSVNGRAYFDSSVLSLLELFPEPPELGGICNGRISNVTFAACKGGWQGGAISAEGRGINLDIDSCSFVSCEGGT